MRRSPPLLVQLIAATVIVCGLAASRTAHAQIELRWSGRIQTDIRFRVNDISVGPWYAHKPAKPGVARNDNLFKLRVVATAGRFAGVAEIDFVWYGFALDLEGFKDLYRREIVDAYRLEARAAYVEATDLIVRGLDVRIGQQTITWGVGDQFNPTNVINANDLEDPLLFGDQLGNVMVRADYTPTESWTVSGVMVPIFKPALLPRTAPLGLALIERLPFNPAPLRHRVHTEQALLESGTLLKRYPTVVDRAQVVTPDFGLDNIQWAARVRTLLADQDVALSYYYGRFDIPQPFINITRLQKGRRCRPGAPDDCIDGLLQTAVGLYFPRMHMVALNVEGQLPNPLALLWDGAHALGYRIELGVFFPQAASIALLQRALPFEGAAPPQPAGEYDYQLPGGGRPQVIESTPFAKWVVGLDYTFDRHFYLNAQWVHGFPDEFGAGGLFSDGEVVRAGGLDEAADKSYCARQVLAQNLGSRGDFSRCAREILRSRIGDYLVLGLDTRFFDTRLLARLFFILDLIGYAEERWDPDAQRRVRRHLSAFSADGFSAVVFPEITYNFGHGLELSTGALLKFGKTYTKFGDPAAGGHVLWTRARYTY